MRKKVLFVIQSLVFGGAERVFVHLMNNLNRDRFDITLCVLKKTGPYFSSLTPDVSIEVLDTELATSLFKIKRCIKRTNPDIVISTLNFINAFVAIARLFGARGPRAFIARECNIPSYRRKGGSVFDNRLIYRFTSSLLDKIICQSDDMLIDIVEHYGISRHKLLKIHNPIDFHSICSSMQTEVLPPNKTNLVAAGRLEYQKGFDLLIEALAIAKDKNLCLHILGEGRQRPLLENMVKDTDLTDQIRFHGFVSDPYPFMRAADGFVLPSRFEGLPNALLEAMACGCPGIAFCCSGGINEIIDNDKNGYAVEEGNVKALANVLVERRYLKIDREYVSKSIEDRFALKTIVQQYESMFELALQENK